MAGKSLFKRLLGMKVLGASLGGAAILFIGGIIAWGGFNTVMEATNSLDFCVSCHEMEQTVYQEYKQSVHYENRTGVRAICSDCHVPHPWVYKIIRKVQASNEILHKLLGSINTPEKFEAKRPTLAANEWRRMKDSNSRECRNCHSFTAMSHDKQKKRAGKQHEQAVAEGQTCIDCHKGIAHRKPNDDGSPLPTWEQHQAAKAKEDEARKVAEAAAKAAEEAKKKAAAAAPAAAVAAAGPGVDWATIAGKTVTLFYPGQTSWEWVLNGPDHGGARAYKKGEACAGCHEGEQEAMGTKMATGEKAETTPIPGKAPAVKMTVKAAHDGTNLYMNFSWPAGPHTPAPFAEGGKMDPKNPVKLALMIDAGKVEEADRSGCWSTCHHDVKSMPDGKGEATKYLPQSRTALSIKDSPRGGADKLKDKADLDKLLADGVFLDLLRWKAGENVSEDGHIAAERVMTGGQGVSFTGSESGGTWSVTMVRKLTSDKPGDVSIEPGKTYTVGFALHDDYTSARFHHVSVNYTLGLENDKAGINAVKIAAPAAGAAPAPAQKTGAAPAGGGGSAAKVDWSKASEKSVMLFYPGQTSWEWINNGPDHGGARAFKKGEKCSGCHEGEQDAMGKKMATGEKAETTPIPGKAPAIKMTVKATHDAENLYMQFSWPAGPHTPAPFAAGGKMDPENPVKLALMIDAGKVEDAERSGCWSTCHHDVKSMPDGKGEATKYLPQSRTALSIKESPRGGVDKLKDKADLDKLLADGVFLDLLRWKSGKDVSEDGHISAERVMTGGQGVSFTGSESGGTWTVTMVRKLKSDKPGDVSLEPGKTYTVGFALHDDYTAARFHHVSVDYPMALDTADVAISVPGQ